uniref:Cytochrome c oxidase subunit n=1 Tax=Leersia perrieri TaxID=77586 RepID=A0A0D9VZJ1_9ORYZ
MASAAAAAAARSGLRSLVARAKATAAPAARRRMSSAHDDAHETAKWEKITYAGIVTCTLLAAYNLSKGHPHFDEPPAYPYLHIRNKEFPWGPDGLFESKHH